MYKLLLVVVFIITTKKGKLYKNCLMFFSLVTWYPKSDRLEIISSWKLGGDFEQ